MLDVSAIDHHVPIAHSTMLTVMSCNINLAMTNRYNMTCNSLIVQAYEERIQYEQQ